MASSLIALSGWASDVASPVANGVEGAGVQPRKATTSQGYVAGTSVVAGRAATSTTYRNADGTHTLLSRCDATIGAVPDGINLRCPALRFSVCPGR